MTQWDFQNKGTHTSPARLSFVLEVPLRHLRPSVIYSVPCDGILQRAYSQNATCKPKIPVTPLFKNTHVQYCRIESIRQNNVLFAVDRKNSI